MITAHYCDKQTGRESTVTWHVRRRAWTVTVYDLETGRYLDPVYRFGDRAAAEASAQTVIRTVNNG